MVSVDKETMLARLKSLLPSGWFGFLDAVTDAILGGLSDSLTSASSFLDTVRAGTRRAGMAGWLLDLDAYGFFGSSFRRWSNEGDDSWRKRYTDEIFRPRVTRAAIDKALYDLTGRHPVILEMFNPADTGGYGSPNLCYGGGSAYSPRVGGYNIPVGGYGVGEEGYGVLSNASGAVVTGPITTAIAAGNSFDEGLASAAVTTNDDFGVASNPYSVIVVDMGLASQTPGGTVTKFVASASRTSTVSTGAGRYGSLQYPYQIFITAYRPMTIGIPNVAGYGSPVGGYGVGTITYADLGDVKSTVSDEEIYATIARTVGAGITPWTAIRN